MFQITKNYYFSNFKTCNIVPKKKSKLTNADPCLNSRKFSFFRKIILKNTRQTRSICSVGSKIIRALEIIRVEKLIPITVLRNKYLSSHNL